VHLAQTRQEGVGTETTRNLADVLIQELQTKLGLEYVVLILLKSW